MNNLIVALLLVLTLLTLINTAVVMVKNECECECSPKIITIEKNVTESVDCFEEFDSKITEINNVRKRIEKGFGGN